MKNLTEKQRETIDRMAHDKEYLRLYASDSLSGYSLTLRAEQLRRQRSGGATVVTCHVLSVTLPDAAADDPEYKAARAAFEAKSAEAQSLFHKIRTGSGRLSGGCAK